MSWIPLIFGSAGSFGGGYISDRLSRNRGVKGRLLVLIGCCVCLLKSYIIYCDPHLSECLRFSSFQLVAAPFQVGLLVTEPPYCFVCHIGGYLVGEMWLGVCLAIVVELVPNDLTASAVAVYFFIIQIIGGNMTLFVTPLTDATDYRTALIILFPGMYVAAALLFMVTLAMVSCRENSSSSKSVDLEKTSVEDDNPTKSSLNLTEFDEITRDDADESAKT